MTICDCGHVIYDVLEECEHKITDSGASYNFEHGQEEHWFYAECVCPECGCEFEYTDSSL
jgi:hypothetical protein